MSMNKRAKKSIVLTLGLVVGGMYASTNSIFAAEKEIVTPEKLNVRKGPSVENDKIGSLDRGMVVEILESNNGWNKVKLSDGNEGWVSGDYTEKEKGTVTATELNVRKGPSIENDKIGSLANGTVVEVLEHENDWYKVKLDDNKEGWISGDYVLTESQAMEQQAKKTEVKAATTNTVEQKNDTTVKEEKSEEAVSNNTQNNNQNNTSNESSKTEETTSSNNNSGRLMTVNASAYAGHSITATGTTPKWGTIAVDPSVIPYGTKVYIPKFDMVFTAEDCGGAIKGNKIDIFMNSESECTTFGRQNIEIQILG
ncbi:SH3 domain-containing protein [Paraclostridium bifermentans]|uniref:SH3 domain-containing protein n=1 Tax=Paraclostridium bifermentans TaxID=1490 RepID=UPI001FF5B4DD|nr:SH3 domain-containing protein [Paraclostridium bifermentans]UOW68806.1 SH3 domain-containing protein [Paraclostridium bifermentans]